MNLRTSTSSVYLSLLVYLSLPNFLQAQNFESLVQDGIYELEEVRDLKEALYFFNQAESKARYQRNKEQIQQAQLLILKAEYFYSPYFEMEAAGKISVEEARLLDAYHEYQISLDLVKQNQQFKSHYTANLDNTLIAEAKTNFNRIQNQLDQAFRKHQRLAEEATFSKNFSSALFHLKKARSYLNGAKEEELKLLDQRIQKADCHQQWYFGQMLFDHESYEMAIQAFEQIEISCKDHFKVKEKIAQVRGKLQHQLVAQANLLYQDNKHEEAKALFNKTKAYGETAFYKEQLQIVYDELIQTGENYLDQKLYKAAIQEFSTANIYINSSEVKEKIQFVKNLEIYNEHVEKGNQFLQSERISLALDQFKEAVVVMKTEEIKQLIELCNNYIKYLDKGDRYADKNKSEKALEAYNLAASAISTEEIQRKLARLR